MDHQTYEAAVEAAPGQAFDSNPAAEAMVASSALCRLNYDPDLAPQALFERHIAWAARYAAPHYPGRPQCGYDPDPARTLRVGYVSGDLQRHPVTFFVEPILRSHDPARFDVHCYSNTTETDDLNQHLRSLTPNWRDIAACSDDEVALIIREDKIDILVDLSGHTARNRLLVFARRPAPVQVSAIAYVTTSGLATMDYRLTDAWCDPPGLSDGFHTETLWRLPFGFNCYAPPKGLPDPGPPPLDSNGYVTFGSFNNFDKISPLLLDLWSLIVASVPGARVIFKTKSLGDPAVRAEIMDRFAAAGVAENRVDLIEWSSTLAEHFDWYRKIDIALDPVPYNGTTMTCEALAMGVPVVALEGNQHASRVSYSILARVGLDFLTAPTATGYLARAVALATQPDSLRALRASLRQRLARSPLLDTAGYTRALEAAYREMWCRWCDEEGGH